MKGTIALDIDGTITAEPHNLPPNVVNYFQSLHENGWRFIFITGRTFKWGYEVLKWLPFNYFMAVQNGAIILEMPTRTILSKKYIDRSIFPLMDRICHGEPTDYVLYSGYERNDVCYYRPQFFSKELLSFVQARVKALGEDWRAVSSYSEVKDQEFPSIKCFGHLASAQRIVKNIQQEIGLHVPVIRDPFDETYYVVQATHPEINKGQALRDLLALKGGGGVIIAAGDDNNDRSMLENADCKIVMQTAPEDMQAAADVIAPSAAECGIIQGLKDALKKFNV